MITISPSLLAADFSKLGQEVIDMYDAGAQWMHIDVMDGHFVPNISLGPVVVKSIRPSCNIFFDVHLMISDPVKYAPAFASSGADLITFHLEAVENPAETIKAIRALGKKVGISIKPKTPAEAVFPYLPMVDLVLIMTVEPGFGGQRFMADMMPKLLSVKKECLRLGLSTDIEVDGGIDTETAKQAVANGANVLVAGSSLYSKEDYKAAVSGLIESAEGALSSVNY